MEIRLNSKRPLQSIITEKITEKFKKKRNLAAKPFTPAERSTEGLILRPHEWHRTN